jgi:AcrR family transcriptional regulator
MVYKKTQKVREKLQNKKEKIIKAAKEILAEKSYGEISIKAIAKKAGIATGTFYLYFSNKEALIDSIVEEMYQELLAVIKSERSKYDCVFDKLQASMEACLKLFIKEENLAKILLVKLPGINNAFNKKLAEIEKELIKLTKKDLDDLKTQGLLPEQDTLVSATAFVGTFRQVLISWLKEGEPQDLQSAFKTLMKYNLRGLGKNV